ncbi:hypothetical protein D3C85_1193490 [compost metagenome]
MLRARIHIRHHAFKLLFVDDGAQPRVGVERIARVQTSRMVDDLLQECVFDGLVDDETRTGIADLPGVAEDAGGDRLCGGVQVAAISKDDMRAFSAAFQADALDIGEARVLHEELPHLGRTCKSDRIYIHVHAKRAASRVTESGNNVQHAGRDARFGRQLGDADSGKRRLFGRLEHHGIAGSQCRAQFPARH